MRSDSALPLRGIRIVSLALNVPGPVAAARLATMGAEVVKIEPPGGDPLMALCPAWYQQLHESITTLRLDLKTIPALERTYELLASADVFLTSFRPSSLQRLKLGRAELSAKFPTLAQVAIVGEPGARSDVAGHDLTYQAIAGLLTPPTMPLTLLADLSGAERTVSATLALLFARSRGHGELCSEVSLAESVQPFVAPLSAGLTTPTGPLGGANPFYHVYQSQDGWIAVAALEPQFAARLNSELQLTNVTVAELEVIFASNTSSAWEAWAATRDVPISAVRLPRARRTSPSI